MGSLSTNEAKMMSALIYGKKYGLEIIASIKEDTDKAISLGGLYTTLHRLEKKGYVKSKWGEATPERGGNRRRYYQLSGAGEKALKEFRTSFTPLWNWNPQEARCGFLSSFIERLSFRDWEVQVG